MREGWQRLPIARVASLDIDRVAVVAGQSYPIAGVLNAGKGLFAREQIDGSATNYSVLHRLHSGQLVMRKLTAWEGPITTVTDEYDGYFVSPEFPTFTINRELIEPSYMRLVCQTPALWEAMKDTSTGTVQRRKRVSPSALLSIEFDVPPLHEQRRIVSLLTAVQNVTDCSEAVSNAAWNVASAALDAHEQNASGDPAAIRDVLSATVGGIWGSEPGEDEIDVPVFRSTEFRSDGRLATSSSVVRSVNARQLATRQLVAGDILLEKSGGGPKQPVGRVVFVEQPTGPSVCANFIQLVRPDPARVDPRYLFFRMWNWHRTGRTREYQSHTTGIRNLRTKDYLAQSLLVPAIDEQRAFVSLIQSIVSAAHAASDTAVASSTVRSSLLAELLSGNHLMPSDASPTLN